MLTIAIAALIPKHNISDQTYSYYIDDAICRGKFDKVKFLCLNIPRLNNYYSIVTAAELGEFETLVWMYKNKMYYNNWVIESFTFAAEYGHLDIMKFIFDNFRDTLLYSMVIKKQLIGCMKIYLGSLAC